MNLKPGTEEQYGWTGDAGGLLKVRVFILSKTIIHKLQVYFALSVLVRHGVAGC
jgi:hypothetical protein